MITPIQSSSPLPLFVYGTLMAPAVIETLISRQVFGRPAQLPATSKSTAVATTKSDNIDSSDDYQYSRHPVNGQVYPGLVNWTTTQASLERPQQYAKHGQNFIVGRLYCDLTEDDMQRLDFFEGDQYSKELCNVQLFPNSDNKDIVDRKSETADVDNSVKHEVVQAVVYVWTHPRTELDLTQDWSYNIFEQEKLSMYLETNVKPCRDQFDET
jgi:Gamma-glutamyl cyclotransferase, AIG2-like